MSRLFYLAPGVALFAAMSALAATQPGLNAESATTMASPAGVTLRVIRIGFGVNPAGSNSNQPRDRIVFATEKGQVLYSSAKDTVAGKSTCNDACAKEWPPFLADAGAVPLGQWSIVTRDDGAKQWAFRGQPMYTYAVETNDKGPLNRELLAANPDLNPANRPAAANAAAGAAQAGVAAVAVQPNASPAANTTVAAGAAVNNTSAAAVQAAANLGRQGGEGRGHDVDGRQVVELQPMEWVSLPAGIEVREVRTAPGQVFTNEFGRPLYALSGKADEKLAADWVPFAAPQLALPVGDFTVANRKDGIYQWVYQGKPLYTFKGDLDYGDANGKTLDSRLQLVYVLRYFMPPDVTIVKNHMYGGLLTTVSGQTLYARESSNGGSDGALRADRGRPATGERIGVTGCDADCEKTWKPLLAADDAKPTGYWNVFSRPDGKKQWGYYGYALYTYGDSKAPMNSNEIYDSVAHYENVGGAANKGFPLHWRVSPP